VVMAPEGVSHPDLWRRWRSRRWLAARWSIRFWSVRLLAPLIRLLRGDRWLQSIYQQRRSLRQSATACRLLFQRRATELRSEWLNEALPHLKTPVLILQPTAATETTRLAHTLFKEYAPHAHVVSLPGDEDTAWGEVSDVIRAFATADAMSAIAPDGGELFQRSATSRSDA